MHDQFAKAEMRRIWLRLMLLLLGAITVMLGALYFGQRALIYFPTRLSHEEFAAAVTRVFGVRASVLAPFDAVVLEPPRGIGVRGTAILFHGNAALGLDRGYYAPEFARRGLRLILAEYPGYGPRSGSPSEKALVADGSALYEAVARRFPDTPIIVVGESLGTGVAVQVAARTARAPARLVLLTPFMSLEETAVRAYRWLPVRLLLRDRFASADELPRYRGPVAILVAANDEVVGASQGRSLADLTRSRGETVYVEVPEAGHNSWMALVSDAQWTELLGAAIPAS